MFILRKLRAGGMKQMLKSKNASESTKLIFEEYPVKKALAAMIMPTIVSQLILVVYNMADTWYVGRTGNADAVAAISLCLPVYTILSAISNLFGIGGASAIARAFGSGDQAQAKQAFSLASYGALCAAALYAVLIQCFSKPLLLLIGADAGDLAYAVGYAHWTIVIGAVPTILAPSFAHMIRAAGHAQIASFGMILGALLNIALDPLFMFVLLKPGNEVAGAAIATVISNAVSLLFFLGYMALHRENDIFSFRFFKNGRNAAILFDVLRSGIPGFSMQAFAMFSNCFLNAMLSTLGSEAVAGIGIVRKIDQLAYAVNQGITQGMLPLVAYCFSSGRHDRMKEIILYSAVSSFAFSVLCSVTSFLLAPQLVGLFIRDDVTIGYGAAFLRVLCLAIPIYSITLTIVAVFQAVGNGMKPFLLTVLRKGSLDILMMFVLKAAFGVSQILWASPITETLALCIAVGMLVHFYQTLFLPSADPVCDDKTENF